MPKKTQERREWELNPRHNTYMASNLMALLEVLRGFIVTDQPFSTAQDFKVALYPGQCTKLLAKLVSSWSRCLLGRQPAL